MAQKIFITSTEEGSGKSLITIGLMRALQGIVPKVGYMKPIGQRYDEGSTVDSDAVMMKVIFDLEDSPSHINPISMQEAQQSKDTLFEKTFECYRIISENKDVVFIEGTDYTSTIAALELDINAELARNLVAPVLLVAKGYQKSINEIISSVSEVADSFKNAGCRILGAIINRFDSPNYEKDTSIIIEALEKKQIPLFGVILNHPVLSGPRLREVADELNAEILFQGDDLSKVVTDTKILAMTPEHALEFISDKDGYLLIAPGDRVEHIFTVMIAQKSIRFPEYAGMILTGDLQPSKKVWELVEGITDAKLTILSVKGDTFATALKVNQITGELTQEDPEKLEIARMTIQRYVDIQRIRRELGTMQTDIVTPRMFQYRILEKAKSNIKRIVLPEGLEPRILKAAEEVLHKGICEVVILGDKNEISHILQANNIHIDPEFILDHLKDDPKLLEEYAQTLYDLRKHKGVTIERARDSVLDPVVYAALMVYKDHADGYVSGATHSTADTLRPVLQLIRTKPTVSIASSVFFMCLPEQVVVYGDCALVAKPTAEELADIAITSAETAKSFGVEPVVAMLSYSTGESGTGVDVDKVRQAALIARERRPDLLIEGPLQYDAATSKEVAAIKFKDSAVAGKATVYIFPDLDAGNTAYKAVQRSANVPAIGPVLQGLNKPANDLSRGAMVTDIVYTIAITAIQAQQSEGD